jgi:hypothetical protein
VDSQIPDPLPATSLNAPSQNGRLRLPADYYASPVADVSPLFPRWVPLGCGSLAIVILVLLFAGGALILGGGGGGGRIVDFFFESIGGDLRQMMSKDVAKPDRDALELEMKKLHDNISSGRVSLTALQPLLKSITSAIEDKRVSTPEVRQLTTVMRDLNRARPPAPRQPARGQTPE